MGALRHLMDEVKAKAAAKNAPPKIGHLIPPEVTNLLNSGVTVDPGKPLDTVGDAFQNAFSNAPGSGSDLMVVPVGPSQGGSGVGVGLIVVLGLLGVGGYLLYRHNKAAS